MALRGYTSYFKRPVTKQTGVNEDGTPIYETTTTGYELGRNVGSILTKALDAISIAEFALVLAI